MAALEGGAGGKFRKRPFRRGSATPYDRPPTAARLGLREEGERGGGWLSRLVDPASRMIATGATRLFSSVFRKRLGAPPSPPPQQQMEPERRVEILDAVTINTPSLEVHGQEDSVIQTFKENSEDDGLSELEQLLNQKTFTKVEFDRLTELLRSRTVGLSADSGEQKIEASTSKQPAIPYMEGNAGASEKEDGILRTSKLLPGTPKTYSLNLPSGTAQQSEKMIDSPTELAKSYMGSKSLKPSLPSTSYSMVHREPASLSSQFLPKASETPLGPKSSIHLSGLPEYGLRTPRSQGRSALYMMSRSPYFKTQTMASNKGRELSTQGYDGYPRSQLVQSEFSLSAGKQPLKRRSSVLDSDIGSVGPIRRIRQKSNLPSSKDLAVLSCGRLLTTSENGLQGSATSIQKPSVADSAKYNNLRGGGKRDRLSSVPHQSSQMAGKILQLVDQIVPSPKKKVLELNAGAVESPPKLSIDMLNNQALNSIKDIDSSKLFKVQGNDKVDGGSGSSSLKASISLASPTQNKAEGNGPLLSISPGTKAVSDADRVFTTFGAQYCMTKESPSSIVPDVASKKPAFKMQVPESLMELDTENQAVKDASRTVAIENELPELSAEIPKPFASEGIFQKSSFASPPESKPHVRLMPSKEDTQKLQVKVAKRDNGFTFPVAPSESSSQPPPTPSIPVASLDQSVPQKDASAPPTYNFGFGIAPATLSFSSTATSSSDSSGIKFGIASSSTSQVIVSAAAAVSSAPEYSSPVVRDKKEGTETFKHVGDFFPTLSKSTDPVFSSGPSASSSLSNGSLKITATSSFPSAVALEPSDNLHSISCDGASASIKAPSFPETIVPTSATTVTASSSELATIGTQTNNLDSKPFKTPSISSNTVASGALTTFSNSGSSILFSSTAPNQSPSFGASLVQFGHLPNQAAAVASESALTVVSASNSSASVTSVIAGGSMFPFGNSGIGSTSANKSFPFGSSSGGEQSSSMLTSNSSTSGSHSGISFGLSTVAPNVFGSSSSSFPLSAPVTNLFSSSSNASFLSPATNSSVFTPAISQASSIFGLGGGSTSSQSIPSIFGSSASPAGFTFPQSSAAPASTPAGFGASSSVPFLFTSATASTTPSPIFGSQTPIGFASSPGNDQMNVEDSMTEDTSQPAMPVMPLFGQTANSPMAQNLAFGSSPLQPSGFQFASQPTPAFTQPQPQFQAPGNLEFTAGGSFSLGSGGGDKSTRRIVKVKRDKLRKK